MFGDLGHRVFKPCPEIAPKEETERVVEMLLLQFLNDFDTLC